MRQGLSVNEHRRVFQEYKKGPLRVMQDSLREEVPERDTMQPELDLGSLLSGEMTLAARTSSGEPAVLKVPHSILAVLVTIALALVAGGFWLVSSITEMKTNLASIQQTQREARATQANNLKLMIAYSTNETNRIQFMTALLSDEGRKRLYEWDKVNPRPQLPSPDDPNAEDERNP